MQDNNRIAVPVVSRTRQEVVISSIRARTGDTISWNAQDSNIILFIPDAYELFGSEERTFDIAEGSKMEFTVRVELTEEDKKIYPYAIFHKNIRDFAEGGSSPKIIIEK